MRVSRKEWDAPVRPGASTRVATTYRRASGPQMLQTLSYQSKSDRFDAVEVRRSENNGRDWSAPVVVARASVQGDVTIRNRVTYWLDEPRDRLLEMRMRLELPQDEVQAGRRRLRYSIAVSSDGAETFGTAAPVIEDGDEFDADHPVRGVWFGRNGYLRSEPCAAGDGRLLVAIQLFPLDANGAPYNPLGALTYADLQFLHGTWDDAGTRLRWRSTKPIRLDHRISSRGIYESTVAVLADGRIACLSRGSNRLLPDRPCYQWLNVSADGGWTWDAPRPLSWSDGSELHHPSAHSRLLRHSGGQLYWFGNPLSRRAEGNSPRYPLVVAPFNEERLGPVRDQAVTIDTRGKDESAELQLSNFQVYEDRETHDMVVTLCRLFASGKDNPTTGATKYLLTPD